MAHFTLDKEHTVIIPGENVSLDGLLYPKDTMSKLNCIKKMEIIPGATHLFEEPGTLNEVARLAKTWFVSYKHSGPSG
jgi:putative phosphoribosyl transferase